MWALVSAVSQDSEEEETSEEVDSEAEVELASSWKMKTAAHPVFIFASHSQTQNPKPPTSRPRSSLGNPQLPHSETPNTLKKSRNPNPQTPSHHNPPPVPRIQLPQNQTKTKSRGTFKALPRHSHPRTPSTTLHHECNAILLCSSPTLEQGQCSSSREAVSNFGALERCECGWPQQPESWSWSRFQGVYFLTYTHTYKNGKDSIGVYHSRAVV